MLFIDFPPPMWLSPPHAAIEAQHLVQTIPGQRRAMPPTGKMPAEPPKALAPDLIRPEAQSEPPPNVTTLALGEEGGHPPMECSPAEAPLPR